MDCLFLLIWTLPIPLVWCSSVKLLPTLLSWNVIKTLQFCCSHSVLSGPAADHPDHHGLNQDYVFVTPVEVDSGGGYVSHDVGRRSRHVSQDVGRRSRRSRRSAAPPARVHYRLSAFGRDLLLDLRPSPVVAPGFTVHTLGRGGVVVETPGDPGAAIHGCLYQGSIRSQSPSSAAISTCSGLSGLIRVSGEELFIAPLPPHLASRHNYSAPSGHHPHVVYKRSAESLVHQDHLHPHQDRLHPQQDHLHPQQHHLHPQQHHLHPQQDHLHPQQDHLHPQQHHLHPQQHHLHPQQDHLHPQQHHLHPQQHHLHPQQHHLHPQQDHLHPQQHHLHPQQHHLQHGNMQRQHFCGRRKQSAPQRPPGGAPGAGRGRRSPPPSSSGAGLTVETLVVVDQKMLEKHGRDNVSTYALTVMNMVSSLFKDGSIGSDINVVVVSLLLLEHLPLGLSLSHHADQSLNSFCQWQAGLVGQGGRRHDHAVLLTGLDICSWKNQPCDTLGFAPISGMCSKYRSCTINEDTGLGLAFTIAHESGHNFGMIHDGEGTPCRRSEGSIMSPTLAGNNGVFSWSSCSRQYLSRFLGTAQAWCLGDAPQGGAQVQTPQQLPGQLYDAHTQCRWQLGPTAQLCRLDFVKDICKSLWCQRVGHRCETKFLPAAEGTACGPDTWCRRGQCVGSGAPGPPPVHGQWSGWSQWSQCSRTCGGGVMSRERSCTNPGPQNDGRFCVGGARVDQLCSLRPCPPGAPGFRAQQCSAYDSRPFRGWFYRWRPYTAVDQEDVCKLYCITEDFDFFFAMSSKVQDGTSCSEDRRDVCINGACEAVGCDQVLGSKASLDVCGVCKGDNSTCRFFSGRYTLQHHANEYYSVVTVPAGARSISVQEVEASSSYLAVRSLAMERYLTGDWTVDWPGKFLFGGTVFDYQRPFDRPERLYAAGPTNETLVFEILLQGQNPGVMWEYTLPPERKPDFTWGVARSDCSATCAGGRISTKAICLQDQKVQVTSSLCDPRTRLTVGSLLCNTQPCPPHWEAGPWGPCSLTCGGGQRSRALRCLRKVTYQREEAAPPALCPGGGPARLQPCPPQACPPQWSSGSWSACSKTCGRGLRKRSVFCRTPAPAAPGGPAVAVLPDSMCPRPLRPPGQEPCVLRRCPRNERLQWTATPWGECSTSCGPGIQQRALGCGEREPQGGLLEFPWRRCRNLPRPTLALQRGCSRGPCPDPPARPPSFPSGPVVLGWYTSPWQQCSASCGGGVQTRSTQCLRRGRPAAGCHAHQRPASFRACHTHFCPAPRPAHSPTPLPAQSPAPIPAQSPAPSPAQSPAPEAGSLLPGERCVDLFSWCPLVPQHRVCKHHFYGQQCCKSCRGSLPQ